MLEQIYDMMLKKTRYKNYEKMFNIKNVWFIIMHDVQQKLSNFHGILDIAFYYLVSYIICFFFF
jgi:hypothetical protein